MKRAAVVLLLLAPGCAPRSAAPPQAPAAPTASPAAPAAAPAVPRAIVWTRESAEHRASLLQIYGVATRAVEEAVSSRKLKPGTWAIVTDADETVIDNSLNELEVAQGVAKPYPDGWRDWVVRLEAPPLPGALPFLSRVKELGGVVAIVTNRSARDCPETVANFRKFSIPYDMMLCKGEVSDKNPRFQAVADGTAAAGFGPLEIVAYLGDNILDFPQLSQAVKERSDAAFAPFGQRFFLFPNPLYGSWEPPKK